jgi:putative aldouronate transport system substrate-binding protein
MKKLISLVLCVFVLLSFVVSASGIAVVEIKGLKADKSSLSLNPGSSYKLTITFSPANTTQKLLVFTTSNANVATIDTDGNITAIGAGKATITVASKSKGTVSTKITVTVVKPKPVVLRVEVYDRGNAGGTPPDNNYWTKWIQANYGDKNNVTLKFETSPRFDNNAKLQMWMAAGTAPDICYSNEIDPVSNFHNNGGLADLNASLDKYGARLKEFLGDYLLTKGVDSKTGERYLLRAKKAIDARQGTWIRKDWLDKLGQPLPTTRDEWYNDMKLFKEKNPDNMGKVVPFCINTDVGWRAQTLIESFKTDKSDMTRYITNNRWMQIFAPGVKDAIKFMNKMYNEGLISKEFPLDTQDAIWTADVISGFGGSIIHNYDFALRSPSPGLIVNLQARRPDAQFVPCDPFKDKDGQYSKEIDDVAGIQIFVPKTSKDKTDEVIKYLNWMADPEVLFFLQYGEEGKNYTMNNGIPQVVAAKGETIQNSANNIDYTMIVNGVMGTTKADTIKRNSLAYSGTMQTLYIQAFNYSVNDGYINPASKINETTTADGKYGSTVTIKANEVYARTITCKPEEFESVWTQQTNALLRAGAGDMMTERKALWKKLHPEAK